ncbi:MAG TPA: DUF475 domain-containing protein [Candidatus Pacearchaeota archaeon]|nr:DUF475 domain-containing protein [Candidatus Pacearchaeota archaeon]
MIEAIITILGLCVFEVICSADNAIVNAHVLKSVGPKQQKFFFTWGLFIAVFIVRGLLPFIIVWLANSSLGLHEIFMAPFTNDALVAGSLEKSKPILLLGGGSYLFLIFLSWLFLEEKKYVLKIERFIYRQNVWFYTWVSIYITTIVYFSIKVDPILALAATIGISFFFITDGFKQNAEKTEKELSSGKTHLGDWSKILYLEVLDASFSIDGVVGAFAFTTSIPLILIGNGLGAIIIREITIKGINKISELTFLKNGAMYSIGFLGIIMILETFGLEVPFYLAPIVTFMVLGVFLYLSKRFKGREEEVLKI